MSILSVALTSIFFWVTLCSSPMTIFYMALCILFYTLLLVALTYSFNLACYVSTSVYLISWKSVAFFLWSRTLLLCPFIWSPWSISAKSLSTSDRYLPPTYFCKWSTDLILPPHACLRVSIAGFKYRSSTTKGFVCEEVSRIRIANWPYGDFNSRFSIMAVVQPSFGSWSTCCLPEKDTEAAWSQRSSRDLKLEGPLVSMIVG